MLNIVTKITIDDLIKTEPMKNTRVGRFIEAHNTAYIILSREVMATMRGKESTDADELFYKVNVMRLWDGSIEIWYDDTEVTELALVEARLVRMS